MSDVLPAEGSVRDASEEIVRANGRSPTEDAARPQQASLPSNFLFEGESAFLGVAPTTPADEYVGSFLRDRERKADALKRRLDVPGTAQEVLPHQTNPLFNVPIPSSPYFTLMNTTSLQDALKHVLKAVITMSEDQKALKQQFFKLEERISKTEVANSERFHRLETQLVSGYVTQAVFAEHQYEEQKRVDRIGAHACQLEENVAKDRVVLLSRIGAIEPLLANLQTDVGSLRNSSVTESMFHAQIVEIEQTYSQLQQLVGKQQQVIDQQFENMSEVVEEHHSTTMGRLGSLDAMLALHKTELAKQTLALEVFERDLSSTTQAMTLHSNLVEKSLRDFVADHQRSASHQLDDVRNSVQRVLDETVTNSDIRVQKIEGRLSMAESKIDVRISNVSERLKQLVDELETTKGELSTVNQVVLSDDKKHFEVMRKVDAVLDGMGEETRSLHQKIDQCARQLKLQASLATSSKAAVLEQVLDVVEQKFSELMSSTKVAVSTRLREYEGELVDRVFHHFKIEISRAEEKMQQTIAAQIGVADGNIKPLHDRFLELSDFATTAITDLAASLSRKVSITRDSLDELYSILCIDRSRLPQSPSDHSDQSAMTQYRSALIRFVRTLPWCCPDPPMLTPINGHASEAWETRLFSPPRHESLVGPERFQSEGPDRSLLATAILDELRSRNPTVQDTR